jgi:two-component system chemotaxis sensor kinase CheA
VLRNAVDHGIETPEERERAGKPRAATIRLSAAHVAAGVLIECRDDGRGLDLDAIRGTAVRRGVLGEAAAASLTDAQAAALIFDPGFSTRRQVTALSGRGVGLDVARSTVEGLKGGLDVESQPGQGCLFRFRLPMTLATTRVLLARCDGWTYAFPVSFVRATRFVAPEEIIPVEGRAALLLAGRPVPVAELSDLLGVAPPSKPARPARAGVRPCLVLEVDRESLVLLVDDLLDEQEIVMKPLGPLLERVRNVAGVTLLGTGEVCMVLNSRDLLRGAQRRTERPAVAAALPPRQTVLVVDDSITTRIQEKRILENAGYKVITATDGVDALHQLRQAAVDAVVTDVEMPRLDGWDLTRRIRGELAQPLLPVIIVSTVPTEEGQKRGLEAGANAFISKGRFDQRELLAALGRLL